MMADSGGDLHSGSRLHWDLGLESSAAAYRGTGMNDIRLLKATQGSRGLWVSRSLGLWFVDGGLNSRSQILKVLM